MTLNRTVINTLAVKIALFLIGLIGVVGCSSFRN